MSIDGYFSNSGKPDTSWWISQIRDGIDWRKECTRQMDWEKWRKMYRGEWPKGTLPVNLMFRMLRTIVPRLYFRDPSVSVVATKPGMEQQLFAQLVERVDNKMVRTMDTKNQIKRIAHNTWMFGTGAGKLGFGAEFTPTPEEFETSIPEEFRSRMHRRIEYNHDIKANMPWFKSVHTGCLIVPKKLAYFSDTPWVGEWMQRPLNDVKNDPRFKNVNDLTSSSGKGFGSNSITTSFNENRKNFIDLVEIRDMRTGKVMVLAPYFTDKVLYFGDDEFQANGRPNTYPLVFNPDDERFWGVPDSVILEPQQLELNEIRTLEMKHRRISLVKIFYKKGAILASEVEKMLNGEVGAGIAIDGDLGDIDVREMGHVPQSLYSASAEVQADVRDSMGFSRNQAGDYSSQKSHNAPTAVEARIVQAASEIRIDERRDAIADMLVSVFEDMNTIIFDKWTDDQVVQVMGPDAMPVWIAFKPAMLKAARYELNIDPDSTLPETKDMRESKAVNAYNLLKSNPLIDPQLLTQYLLRQLHGVEYDHMMRNMQALQQNAAAGVQGATPENPLSSEQFMQQLVNKGRGG